MSFLVVIKFSETYLFFLFICFIIGTTNGALNTITLSSTHNFEEVELPPYSISQISLVNLSSSVDFSVVQLNSYIFNLTLSYNELLAPHSYVNGSSIGLIFINDGSIGSGFVRNDNNNTVDALLALHPYGTDSPVPGGCSLEESVQNAPYLPLKVSEAMVQIIYPLASWPLNVRPATCDRSPLEYEIYHYYLPEKEYSAQTLFAALRLMSDVESIETNGRKVTSYGHPLSRINFSNYIGTGRIFGVIVRGLTSSAAYVPTYTFGCYSTTISISTLYLPCQLFSTIFDKILAASLLFIGIFLICFGHIFYKTQIFFTGFFLLFITGFIVLLNFASDFKDIVVPTSVGIGIAGGGIILLIWAWWGAPVLPIFISTLLIGLLFGSIVSYSPLVDYAVFRDNLTFWLSLFCFILSGPLIILSFPHLSSILFSCFVGSYVLIIPIDHYLGSNLEFIILNVLRRATVSGFETAIIDPPFERTDLIVTVLWASLTLIGSFFQYWKYCHSSRAPFPPPPKFQWPFHKTTKKEPLATETTHLLS